MKLRPNTNYRVILNYSGHNKKIGAIIQVSNLCDTGYNYDTQKDEERWLIADGSGYWIWESDLELAFLEEDFSYTPRERKIRVLEK